MIRKNISLRVVDHPNDDILLFNKDFNLMVFRPFELNRIRNKMDEIEKLVGRRASETDKIARQMGIMCDSRNALKMLNLFRPHHNLKWLEGQT